jgi:subtilisin family serine protease
MKRLMALSTALVLLAALFAAPAVNALADKGYTIGARSPLTAAQVAQLKNAGVNLKYVYKNFGGAAGTIPASKLAAVRALRFVTSVAVDQLKQLDRVQVEAAPASPASNAALPGRPYWLDLMDAEKNTTYTGAGVWVAVVDEGMYPNWRNYFDESQILSGMGRAFNGASVQDSTNWYSGGPHGMATAATIVGYKLHDELDEGGWPQEPQYTTGAPGDYRVPGVAPDAKIIPIDVCVPIGCFGSAINAGVDYITSIKKAHPNQPIVINESLGGSGFDPVEKAAIDAAVKAGVVMVASAGNSGDAGMGYPAAYEPVISAGAGGWVNQWNQYPDKTWWLDDVPETGVDQVFIVDFSSRSINSAQYLDVIAPGRMMLLPYPCVNLYKDGELVQRTNVKACQSKPGQTEASSATFQYLFISGTSFSSPATAGVVALMLQKNPGLSNADANTSIAINDPTHWDEGQVEDILEGAATPIPGGEVLTTFRTGAPDYECWEIGPTTHSPLCTTNEATGHGWLFIDDVLAATP